VEIVIFLLENGAIIEAQDISVRNLMMMMIMIVVVVV
jgi:hypothetical protein